MTRARGQHCLTIALSSDEPPREFRIFTAGEVETTKGTFLFDEAAAKSVMAEYAAHAIDVMLDYDHASLSPMAVDPAQAGKAAGWFNLEVRNGELWAVNVRWTPPAAEALKRKEWRFVSPAFSTDEEGRITSLLNVAITNLPATRRLEPLMAASIKELSMLDAETVKKALAAIESGDSDAALALLKDMIAGAAGGEEAPSEEAPAVEEMAEEPAAEEEDEEQAAVAASISRLTRLTGKTTIGAAVEEVETWRASHLELATEKTKLAKERAALEAGERDALTVQIALSMTPAVAWAEPIKATDRSKRKPAEPFASMPIGDLRGFVAKLSSAKPPKGAAPLAPPAGGEGANSEGAKDVALPDGTIVTCSAREVAMCVEKKIDLKDYAARKAASKKAKG